MQVNFIDFIIFIFIFTAFIFSPTIHNFSCYMWAVLLNKIAKIIYNIKIYFLMKWIRYKVKRNTKKFIKAIMKTEILWKLPDETDAEFKQRVKYFYDYERKYG